MTRSWGDLPKEWLMASLEMGRAHELKALVLQAIEWGFDEPEGLTNNAKRIRWLRECREKAWDMVSGGEEPPTPGATPPVVEKPKRPARKARPVRMPAPRPERVEAQDIFPPKLGAVRQPVRQAKPPVRADLCKIPASEVNEWLREQASGGGR